MQGDFHSIFKGSGLELDDVRAYQYGDDIRTINWNVTAKGHGTFVKTHKEEKEQIVYFILDVSASQEIGVPGRQKLDIGKEICGLLAFSAIKEGSQVGMICFSDQKEKYVKPGKGTKHAYEIFTSLYNLIPKSPQTHLAKAIHYALDMIKRKSVVILISDFIDENYEHNLKALARKHDLVIIHISDKRETQLPSLGIIPLYDNESRKTIWANTSWGEFKSKLNSSFQKQHVDLVKFSQVHQANYVSIQTHEDYVPKLIKLFQVRNKGQKSV